MISQILVRVAPTFCQVGKTYDIILPESLDIAIDTWESWFADTIFETTGDITERLSMD